MSFVTDLNLATYPFRNRLPPYLIAGVLLLLASVSGIICLSWLKQNTETNKALTDRINAANSEIARLRGEGEKVQQQLSPEQKAVLSASHKLVSSKTFAWSRLFADLESVLPSNVAASRIAVQNIYADGDRVKAELDFAVISTDYASVMNMIQNMQNSGLFLAELRGQDLQKTDRMVYTEYTLHLIYSPTYTYAVQSSEVAQNEEASR